MNRCAPVPRTGLAARFLALLLGLVLLGGGCSSPVGVREVSPRTAYRDNNANPMNAGVLSHQAEYVLNRYGLLKRYEKRPAEVIAQLHGISLADDRRDLLYALAEASYLYASDLAASREVRDRPQAPAYFLLSAVYAYYFLLDERSDPPPTRFDLRSRNALELHSLGLWQGLATGPGGALGLGDQVRRLPFGELTLSLDASRLPWPFAEYSRFLPADHYEVRGISVLNRVQGVGLPLVGLRKSAGERYPQALPVTAVLNLQSDYGEFAAGAAKATLALYSAQDTTQVDINGQEAPLETDLTTPLAYRLNDSKIWNSGIGVFLGKEAGMIPNGLYLQQAHRPGRIPVVFVHGTASSPVWWTEMFNTLSFDPVVRQRYEFWYFVYTSSEPVLMSGANLRDALRAKVAALDPEGKDPALRQMVVIGHSQGGLLTKLCAVETGDRLLRVVTSKSMDELPLPEKSKAELRRITLVEPLPFVREVVFLSTPHRGSYRSKWWSRNLVKWLIQLPANAVKQTREYYDYMNDDVKKLMGRKGTILTSADGQSPDNPVLKELATIPLAPWIQGHSIIGVKGDGDPKLGDDGVVTYASAHLDGMASERIVRSGHSTQLNPLAIDEVRRILVEHLDQDQPAAPQ
jgi:pimeloyl-ACP methyl ester carboxylesterase